MKSIRYSSFLLIVLKRKKTKSSAIFSRKLIVFAPPIMCMCNFFTWQISTFLWFFHKTYFIWSLLFFISHAPHFTPTFTFILSLYLMICFYFIWKGQHPFQIILIPLQFLVIPPANDDDIKFVVFFYKKSKKYRIFLYLFLLPATCVLSCSKNH